jgi:hypothetical protein
MWKPTGDALKVGEYPIAAFVTQASQGGREISLIIHAFLLLRPELIPCFLEGFQGVCRGQKRYKLG